MACGQYLQDLFVSSNKSQPVPRIIKGKTFQDCSMCAITLGKIQ